MANPLANRAPQQPSSGGVIALHDHCDMLNRMNFVVATGQPYFVNKRKMPNGEIQHFIDR